MDEPLRAHTLNEVRYYLRVRACEACGQGPWEPLRPADMQAPAARVELPARCRRCGRQRDFLFELDHPAPAARDDGPLDPPAETINPTDRPSRLVDLAQWLSLFSALDESARGRSPEARAARFRAALCLAEALKFYGDDELPPPSAFFSSATAEAFRQHPEKFARQRLRDMQARHPTLALRAGRAPATRPRRRRPWWRFWQG